MHNTGEATRHYAFLILIVLTEASLETSGRHSIIYLDIHEFVSHSTANLKPGRPAAGPLGPEGRRSDGGQLRHLCGPQVWSHDWKLHLLRSGQSIGIQKVSPQEDTEDKSPFCCRNFTNMLSLFASHIPLLLLY